MPTATKGKTLKNSRVIVKTNPPQHPWDRQIGETQAAYNDFVLYRDLGPSRSLKAVVQHRGYSGASNTEQRSSKWAWVARAIAYDEHLDDQAIKAAVAHRKRMYLKQAEAGANMRDYGHSGIRNLMDNGAPLTPDEARRLVESGADIERTATENLTEQGDPMARVQEFERIVMAAIEQESPETADRIRQRLAQVAQTQTATPTST